MSKSSATAHLRAVLTLGAIMHSDATSGAASISGAEPAWASAPVEVACQPDIYTPRGTPSRGKVRDTKPAPRARKREKRSPRHTQRRKR